MSIGEDLALARRQAGLTVTQVSQRTCIRETIINAIERDDYHACGGDFYTRGHIRAIAHAVGTDPGPLIEQYDAAHAAPGTTAGDLLQPAGPVKIRQRHRVTWATALGLALAAAVSLGAYHLTQGPGHQPSGTTGATAAPHHHATPTPPPATTPAPSPHARTITIHLTATEDCWVEFTTPSGRFLFQTVITAGTSKRWAFQHTVIMKLGNPGAIHLTVDGTNPLPPGATQPVTLRLGPRGNILT